jgi:zinc protease
MKSTFVHCSLLIEKIMSKKILLLATFLLFTGAAMASAATAPVNLSNGAQQIFDPVKMAPYASMTILIKAGAADETTDTAGWRQLLASAMMRATTNGKVVLEGPLLTQAAEAAGGQISVQVLDDALAFTAAGDSSTQKELATLLMNVVLHPRLSEADFAAARRGMLRQLSAADRNDVPDHSRATEALQNLLYRDAPSHAAAYGLPPEGTVDSLTALNDQELQELYQKYFSQNNMVISVSGDIDEAGLKQVFSQIPTGAPAATTPEIHYVPLTPQPAQTVQMNTPTPWILVGFRVDSHIAANARDLAALRILTAALTETAPSLLSEKLLMPQGKNNAVLAQAVSGQLQIRRNGSELMIAVQSDAAHLSGSQTAVMNVVNDLKTKPLSPTQLQFAIAYAEGDWAATRDSSTIRAVLAGYAKAQGLFPDTQWPELLKAVTTADVQNAAKKYLGQYATVQVMPQR